MILNLLRSAWLGLAVLAALGALFFGHSWREESAVARALATSGVQAIATVAAKEVEADLDRRRADGSRVSWDIDHVVIYAWLAATRTGGATTPMRIEREVPSAVFHGLSVGDRVRVRYLPEAPWRVEVVPGETAGRALDAGLVAGLLAAGSVGLAAFGAWSARPSRRLLTAGRAARGRVEAVRHGAGTVALTVSFRDLYGMDHRVDVRPAPAQRWAWAIVGAEVPLRYDPQDPDQVALG